MGTSAFSIESLKPIIVEEPETLPSNKSQHTKEHFSILHLGQLYFNNITTTFLANKMAPKAHTKLSKPQKNRKRKRKKMMKPLSDCDYV